MKPSKEQCQKIFLVVVAFLCFGVMRAALVFAQDSAMQAAQETMTGITASKTAATDTLVTSVPSKVTKPKKAPVAEKTDDSLVIETQLSSDGTFKDTFAAESAAEDNDLSSLSEEEKHFVRMNQSLKNMIDENQKLVKQKDDLQKDIQALRGERMIQETRLRTLASEREGFLKKSQMIDDIKMSYEQEIEFLKKELELTAQRAYNEKLSSTQASLSAEKMLTSSTALATEAEQKKAESIAVIRGADEMAKEMGKLVEENQILRKDTIKLHYNLANLFFEQGKYDMSVVEYKRVLDLMPQDAATHYNLAFVSAEYLKDYPTAVEHYKKYIALDPRSSDAAFVKGQILELQLKLQNKIDSFVDKDEGEVDLPLK